MTRVPIRSSATTSVITMKIMRVRPMVMAQVRHLISTSLTKQRKLRVKKAKKVTQLANCLRRPPLRRERVQLKALRRPPRANTHRSFARTS